MKKIIGILSAFVIFLLPFAAVPESTSADSIWDTPVLTAGSADTGEFPVITTAPTGYKRSEEVVYVRSFEYVANWGARSEECTFLSPMAKEFYTGENTYEALSVKDGGTSENDAYKSELFASLYSLMSEKHTHMTGYDETKNLYRYTDCFFSPEIQKADTGKISLFYCGQTVDSSWGPGGKPWNREHTWPQSKILGKDKSNPLYGPIHDDLVMLRPALSSGNSSRGNKAYGESTGYFYPGVSTRGDCARVLLYGYTRWKDYAHMWGNGNNSGVIESMPLLLRWMKEDPVDTWEMGRNDAVESITGTRNVFVDYPEYAWLLFGTNMPEDMVTPSGMALNGSTEGPDKEGHEFGSWTITKKPTETETGFKERRCKKCGKVEVKVIPKLGKKPEKDKISKVMNCKGVMTGRFLALLLLPASLMMIEKQRRKTAKR